VDLGLRDSVVLVTGGSDGLGLALCRTLVGEGAKVALCGRDADRLTTAEAELEALDGDVLARACDVTDPEQLEHLVAATLERFGRLDGLVNNAGQTAVMKVTETTDADWSADLDLKLLAAVRLSRLCATYLADSPHGSILNVLSISGKAPAAASAPTSITRAAGLALTKALSRDLGPDGVRVNAVLIGLIESSQWVRRAEALGTTLDELYANLATSNDIPLGRVGTAHEFADVAAFLLSPRSSFISGAGLNVDGGMSPVS